MDNEGEDNGDKTALILPHAFYLSLTPCGQLGSSNQSALFILSYQQPVTYTFIIDPSVFTYDSALSLLVICVQCYIGPCGVLVPTGRVHSNNEFEFEFLGQQFYGIINIALMTSYPTTSSLTNLNCIN